MRRRGGFRNRDEQPAGDNGGSGIEITREVDACPECAAKQHEVKLETLAQASTPDQGRAADDTTEEIDAKDAEASAVSE